MDTIIFDMDGTVLDTISDLTDSVNYALRRFGCPERSRGEVRAFIGNGLRRTLELAIPGGESHPDFEAALRLLVSHYEKNCLIKTAPYPGIPELLRELGARGYKLGIVSNKTDPAVKELWRLFFSDSVSVAVGQREGLRRKPAPDGVLEALRLLGSSPEGAVYVGDSEVDIATAKNSGLPCISVLWGYRGRAELLSAGAAALAEAPADVFSLITGKNL